MPQTTNDNFENEDIAYSIDAAFRTPSVLDMWPVMLKLYESLGFSDTLTDAQRIDEFCYIVEQYRKYIFSKQAIITKNPNDFEAMLAKVEDLIAKAPEPKRTDDRKVIVYYSLRDGWLTNLYNTIALIIDERKDSYGWME